MLEFPYKNADKHQIFKNSRNFIIRNYGQQAWNQSQDYFQAIDNTRQQALHVNNPSPQITQQYIETLSMYYRRLMPVTTRIPADKIKFKPNWQDTMTSKKFSIPSYNYEKACLLYNLGVAYSRLGNSSNFKSQDGVKQALNYYEVSAGCFDQVRQIAFEFNQITDMSSENLSLMITILQAQAYFCLYSRLDKDSSNKTNLVKIANTIANYYNLALEITNKEPLRRIIGKEYAVSLQCKALQFRAAANYWQSFSEKAAGEETGKGFGIAVSRLRLSNRLISEACNIRGLKEKTLKNARKFQNIISPALQQIEEENHRIYLDDIPQENQLAQLQDVNIINFKFPPPIDILSDPSDINAIEGLIPQPVLAMMAEYRGILADIVNVENERVGQVFRAIQNEMNSMQLPFKINAVDNDQGVPESLWKRISEIQQQGGFGQIQNLMNSLRLIKDNNASLIDELDEKIKREEQDDSSMRQSFGPKWNRTASNAANSYMKADIDKYKLKLKEAEILDNNAINLYSSSQQVLQLLQKPKAELDQMLPNQDISQLADNQTVVQLNQLIENLYQLQNSMGSELNQLTVAVDQENIIGELIKAANQSQDKKTIFDKEFLKFQPFRDHISENCKQIRQCLDEIQKLNRAFDQEFGAIQNDAQRMALLQQLNDAVDRFHEMNNNLTQGHSFYTSLSRLLNQLQQQINDFVYSRSLESQELIEKLNSQSYDNRQPSQYSNLMQQFQPDNSGQGNQYFQPISHQSYQSDYGQYQQNIPYQSLNQYNIPLNQPPQNIPNQSYQQNIPYQPRGNFQNK